ncbi:MAG: cation-translocating P-type ATPase [Mycoplasmatales bacterium]
MRSYTGLTTEEAKKRKEQYGENIIKRKKAKTKWEVLVEVIVSPILLIMMIAAGLSFLTGMQEKSFLEFYVILALVIVNVAISFKQEIDTIQKLESLEKLNEGKSIVIRDSIEQEILSKDLVPGDMCVLKVGSIARADLKVVEALDVFCDEAFLTGESKAIVKVAGDEVYSNATIKTGTIYGEVTKTGLDTRIGQIAREVDEVQTTKSQLEIKLLQITKVLVVIALISGALIFLLTSLNGLPINERLTMTISILIACVPEGLATVMAIVLAFMSVQLSKSNALVKKVDLLETLGEVSYVCSDKTGTITKNTMEVTDISFVDQSETAKSILNLVLIDKSPTMVGAREYFDANIKFENIGKVIDEIPFNSSTKRTQYLVDLDGKRFAVSVGAPDFICPTIETKVPEIVEYATKGLRSLLVTYKPVQIDDLDELAGEYIFDDLICLFGISDPPKESSIEAISIMHEAHIKTILITGDYVKTADAIARQAGIVEEGEDYIAMTGEELNKLSEAEFDQMVEKIRVYARVQPEDKQRIVKALQKKGEIVAMMGDGTNDSIALKQANVGIAMNQAGTDVAKESADLLLLDDNFATVNVAISGGRLMFDNLRKFMRQMLTSNAAHFGSIFFSLLFGLIFGLEEVVLPLTAVLILWVNIISDSIPSLTLGLDTAEKDLMSRKPIDPNEPILPTPYIIEILVRGLGLGLMVYLAFAYLNANYGVEIARTLAFVILSFGQLIHIFDARNQKTIYSKNPFENMTLVKGVALSAILNLMIIYIPFLNEMFGLVAVGIVPLLLAIVYSSGVTFVISAFKYMAIKNN